MNYRHAYHAGGIADVFKHTVLIALLGRCRQKETAFHVLDTHGGIGLYDLSSSEAGKTGEYHSGIATLWQVTATAPLVQMYLDRIRAVNSEDKLRFYPGSPALIVASLRPQDRADICELHEEDYRALKRRCGRSAAIHHRNGYEAMRAFLPPLEKRGLIFIDPAFEETDELSQAAVAIQKAYTKFPQGIFAFWYPVKERPAIWRFHEEMAASGIPRQLAVEFMVNDEGDSRTLNGSGMLLINPPWQIEQELEPALRELQIFMTPGAGRITLEWLAGESLKN